MIGIVLSGTVFAIDGCGTGPAEGTSVNGTLNVGTCVLEL